MVRSYMQTHARRSRLLILLSLILLVFTINKFFFGNSDNQIQNLEKSESPEDKGEPRSVNLPLPSPKSVTGGVNRRTVQAPPTVNESETIPGIADESALPDETTIPPDLLYLDTQPIEVDSETAEDSWRNDEFETGTIDGADADIPDAGTIPSELLELDNEPAVPE